MARFLAARTRKILGGKPRSANRGSCDLLADEKLQPLRQLQDGISFGHSAASFLLARFNYSNVDLSG